MKLTRDLIDRRHPRPVPLEVDRSTDVPDDQLRLELRNILANRDGAKQGLHVFAYGSLIWRPEVPPEGECVGTLYGYHRRFCLHQVRSRGTHENPCLMMALDRGGACRSVLHWFSEDGLEEKIWPILRREMRGRGYWARFVKVRSGAKVHSALTFVANRTGPRYLGKLPIAEAAEFLACGCGPRGACAEYLLRTMSALRSRGIRDVGLQALERSVARRLTSG